MFQGTAITFVSASAQLLEAAGSEGLETLDPVKAMTEVVKEPAGEPE
jgi:hypothetical protein